MSLITLGRIFETMMMNRKTMRQQKGMTVITRVFQIPRMGAMTSISEMFDSKVPRNAKLSRNRHWTD